MNTFTSLVRAEELLAAGFTSLHQRLRERALDDAVTSSPRIWMEPLERRVMLSGSPQSSVRFGVDGWAYADF